MRRENGHSKEQFEKPCINVFSSVFWSHKSFKATHCPGSNENSAAVSHSYGNEDKKVQISRNVKWRATATSSTARGVGSGSAARS